MDPTSSALVFLFIPHFVFHNKGKVDTFYKFGKAFAILEAIWNLWNDFLGSVVFEYEN